MIDLFPQMYWMISRKAAAFKDHPRVSLVEIHALYETYGMIHEERQLLHAGYQSFS